MLRFDTVFCVFARPAIPGATKTRLVPALGNDGAARLASAMFTDTWRAVAVRPGCAAVLACTGPPTGLAVAACGETWFQGAGDLGVRLERMLRRTLERSSWGIVIGADSPGMPEDRFAALLAARHTHDAAIIPAEDGGFVALGAKACPEGVLSGVTFSDPTTCEQVIARLRAAGLSVAILPGWWDVDTPTDLVRLRAWLAEDPARARTTSAVLAG